MRFFSLILLILVVCPNAHCQYSYFNMIFQEGDGTHFEASSQIECHGDTIISFGNWNAFTNISNITRKYSLEGEVLHLGFIENPPDVYPYLELADAFKILPDSSGYLWSGSWQSSDNQTGKLFFLGLDLDTLFTRELDLFGEGKTALKSHTYVADGIMFSGYTTNPDLMFGQDILLIKTDFLGNHLWHEVVAEVSETNETNFSIYPTSDGGFLLSGQRYNDFRGLVTKTDANGVFEWEKEYGSEDFHNPGSKITDADDGSYVVAWGETYDLFIPQNEFAILDTLKLTKFNLQQEVIWERSYFATQQGGWADLEVLADGSIVALGGFNSPDLEDSGVSFLLKTDANGVEQWYHEYYYEACPACVNVAYDLELTSDGGFACVGVFFGGDNDPYDHTWLFKVDACGCMEDCGCPPLGTEELSETAMPGFRFFPNPASSQIAIQLQGTDDDMEFVLHDQLGKVVKRERFRFNGLLNISDISGGIYFLEMVNPEGVTVSTQKLVVR